MTDDAMKIEVHMCVGCGRVWLGNEERPCSCRHVGFQVIEDLGVKPMPVTPAVLPDGVLAVMATERQAIAAMITAAEVAQERGIPFEEAMKVTWQTLIDVGIVAALKE